MTIKEATSESETRTFFLISIIIIVSGIWGLLQPGKIAESININLIVISIPAQFALIIGLLISFLFLGLGYFKEWQYQIGSNITIQNKYAQILGSTLVLLSAFIFIGFDIIAFFAYYYEIGLTTIYALVSLYGLTIPLPSFDIVNIRGVIHLYVPDGIGFNYISIIIGILGFMILLIGAYLSKHKEGFRVRKWIIPEDQSSNLLIVGVVLLLSTIFLASLYQPSYVEQHGVEGKDGILKTIQGLTVGTNLITAISDFYVNFVIYLYPLVIFICGLILLRSSLKTPSQPEPFIGEKLLTSLEILPTLIKRITKLICLVLGLFIVGLFSLIGIQWFIGFDIFLDLQALLFKNVVGIFFLSLIIVSLVYLPKILRPFLDGNVLRYTARRLLAIIPIFIGISIICYSLMLATGSPVAMIMSRLSPGPGRDEVYRNLVRIYGLNAPPQSQWFNWFIHFIMGDMGNSIIYGYSVSDAISLRIMPTLEISVTPLLLTLILSIPLGIFAALRQYSLEDSTISIFVAVGLSIPIFLFILLCILIFAYYIPLLPPGGRTTEWRDAQNVNLFYVHLFKNTFIDTLFSWEIWDLFFHLIIPVGAITMISLALYVRLVRSGYLEIIRQDFILSAQAYGFDERTIIFRHSLKNVMIPLVTYIGLSIGGLLGGAPITETTLSWPGLGYFGVTSIRGYDYPIVMGLIMVTAVLILVANLLTDLLYSIIDPRVTL
ncbi:MAG: ABC transporter permease [Candidatus Thorarchaeota archaeon]